MSIWHCVLRRCILGSPLRRAARALHQLPLIAEQVVEKVVVPLHRVGGPCPLQSAGDRIAGFATAKSVLPAESLLLKAGTLRFGTNIFVRIGSTMGFTERMTAGNQCNRFLVIHRHATERLSNVFGCSDRIWVTVRPLRIDVD